MKLFKTSEGNPRSAAPGSGPATAPDTSPGATAPIHQEIVDEVVRAYRGKTRFRTFPEALTLAAAVEEEGLVSFLNLISQCSPHERGLIVAHLHKNYLHSPRLVEWIRAANEDFFYARMQVAFSGIKKARHVNRAMSQARKIDRDTAGFNVRQESRDAVSIVNGLVQARWTQNVGIAGRRSIISVAASLARLLISEGEGHGLASCYREYTDLYGVRHSIVERDTGLADVVLVHPHATELTCEYIESGEFTHPDDLRSAVLNSSVVLRHQRLDEQQ